MGTISLQKASEILGLAPESVKRLRRDGVLFAWGDKYDESSIYTYQLTQEYTRKNGKGSWEKNSWVWVIEFERVK